jgi:eukaryotic-like serine/threonine-protein kinase
MLFGDRIGRFELRRYLGRGGFSDVWLAFDPSRQGEVALKLIRLRSTDPELLEAERRGIHLQRDLACEIPEIAAIYDSGEIDDLLFISMEYVEGRDLSEFLERGPLAFDQSMGIAIQICRILEKAHELPISDGRRGIVHSDIKPENVRLQAGDQVRLLDWGVAKSLAISRKFTRNSFGSTAYLSPERLIDGVVDRHSDLWAVGVVLYRMVAGTFPFSGTSEEVERKIRSRQTPERLPASCPPDLRKVLARCLALDVERRYPSAALLRADLEACRDGRPIVSAQEDRQATRRTGANPGSPSDGRPPLRGLESSGGGRHEPPSDWPSLASSAAPRPWRLRWFSWIAAAVVLALVLMQVSLRFATRAIERELALQSPDLLKLYAGYQRVDWLDPLGMDLSGTRRDLEIALTDVARGLLLAYRAGASPAEEEWRRSRQLLLAAADLDHDDLEVQAYLLQCQGHLNRIAGSSAADPSESQQLLGRALEEFKEAGNLAPELPDPYLGMIQVYADEKFQPVELEKLQDAYDRAVRLHFLPGEREKKALATVKFRQGLALDFQAKATSDGGEAAALLARARKLFEEARHLCGELARAGELQACREAALQIRAASGLMKEKGYY